MIDTIIFDLDGLMFDTERLAIQAWHEVGKRNHVTIADEFIHMITGGGPQQFAYAVSLYPEISKITEEAKQVRRDTIFAEAYEGRLNKPGLCELLDYLQVHQYQVAVASSSNRAYVDTLLSSIGKPYHFDVVVGGDEVKNAKPAPDIFLHTAQKLNKLPSQCLVIEDSKMGTLAAKRAQMHRIFIQDQVPVDDELASLIEYAFPSLHDVITFLESGERKEN